MVRMRVQDPAAGRAVSPPGTPGRAGAVFVVLAGALGVAGGCGDRHPEAFDATEKAHKPPRADGRMSEADKIRALLEVVRVSDCTFIQAGNERTGAEAAADLERRVARVPAGVPTARQFIDRVGAGRLRAQEQDIVRLPSGEHVPARAWFMARLAELEGTPTHAGPVAGQSSSTPMGTPEVGILDALIIVERSGLRFVAPARHGLSGKVKGKSKDYTAVEFAEMLRKKWEFLGADVTSLEGFIEEIATDSFSSMEPYRVVHRDGTEEEFRAWLLVQLDIRRQALANGVAR